MPRKITRDKLIQSIAKDKKKLRYWKQQEKIMQKKLSEQIRKDRTHRLCNHGADLEVYLKPELYSDEQIRKMLKDIFVLPEVKEIVAREAPPKDDQKVHFEEMRNYTP